MVLYETPLQSYENLGEKPNFTTHFLFLSNTIVDQFKYMILQIFYGKVEDVGNRLHNKHLEKSS